MTAPVGRIVLVFVPVKEILISYEPVRNVFRNSAALRIRRTEIETFASRSIHEFGIVDVCRNVMRHVYVPVHVIGPRGNPKVRARKYEFRSRHTRYIAFKMALFGSGWIIFTVREVSGLRIEIRHPRATEKRLLRLPFPVFPVIEGVLS